MIYYVLLSLPLLFGFFHSLPEGKTVYRYFVACYFVALILVSGLRWTTGTDWEAYRQYFQDENNINAFEFGYTWLTHAVRMLTSSYSVFLVVDAVLALVPIWLVLEIENGANPLSLAVFFSYYYTINYLGANRRIIAIGICFLALYFLRKRKGLIFLLLCLLSFCFHRSSLVFLLAWPIYHLKPNKKFYVALILFAALFQALNPFQYVHTLWTGGSNIELLDRVFGYSDNNFLVPGMNYALQNTISIVKRSLFLALIYWGWSKQDKTQKADYAGLLNIYMFSFVLYLMFTGTVELFKTFTVYFSIVELLLIPRAMFHIDKYYRPIVYLLFACMLFIQQYSALTPYWDLYVPYKSIFWGAVR